MSASKSFGTFSGNFLMPAKVPVNKSAVTDPVALNAAPAL
jgi:hypothetical protein